ncbi:MAG: prealbumin-like fold domain-containing protein [Clostridiales Family XIII bacterium]|jgi:hypothetical protein|nr:prealbumin-like fold domain-containing protein [Clostridiales Family XIII bacterium]
MVRKTTPGRHSANEERAFGDVRAVFRSVPDSFGKMRDAFGRTTARVRAAKNPMAGKSVRFGKRKLPVALLTVVLVAAAAIVPTAMAFGSAEPAAPTGKNLGDSIEITNAYFYPGTPSDKNKIAIGQDNTYENGVPIQNGEYTLFFEWLLKDQAAQAASGDWFDLTVDLGLTDISAKIKEQKGASLLRGDGEAAGRISWINAQGYAGQGNITLRVTLNDSDIAASDSAKETDGTDTGLWGFRYEAAKRDGTTDTVWQITVGAAKTPAAGTHVIPQPSGAPAEDGVVKNPYDKNEPGYLNLGQRLTPDAADAADTIVSWSVFVNGHKHKTIEEWAACPNNTDVNTLNDDPAPAAGETFTIAATSTGLHQTWLRDVTNADGKAAIDPASPVLIDKSAGRYGKSSGDRGGAAYLKLFYVNSAKIWGERIDQPDSGYQAPASDKTVAHKPAEDHPVGAYDTYFSTGLVNEGEESALLYAPNYSGTGENYYNYLTPVPPTDIKSITLSENGFEIEMFTDAVLGRTLAISHMTKAAADAEGVYGQNVSSSIAIRGVNGDVPVAVGSARILPGGAVSPDKGKFVLENLDRHTTLPLKDVGFAVAASSTDALLAQVVNSGLGENAVLKTDANGKAEITLPPLPWSGNLTLTLTETAPEGYVSVNPIAVTIEPVNGTVISVASVPAEAEAEDQKPAETEIAANRFGLIVWNKSIASDTNSYDAALRTFVKKVERGEAGGSAKSVFLNSEPNTDVPDAENGDRVLVRVDVYNQGRSALQVTKITAYVPAGMKFDPAATVQHPEKGQDPYTNALWQLKEGTDNIVEYIGPAIDFAWNIWLGTEGIYPEHRLPLVLTVDAPADIPDGSLLIGVAEITEIKDLNGGKVEDIDSTPDADKDNDGAVPGVEYGETPPPGTVTDNDIEGRRINENGEPDRAADEDDHDYTQIRLSKGV